jgi:hypothetical protein
MTDPLQSLTTLVVKDRVSLGGLSHEEQALALALAHAALPAGAKLTEREINEALKAALAGPACWLATDHVELRRWLVDAGWLMRDGFGRQYHVLPHAALRAQQQPTARLLATLGPMARWVGATRARQQQERAARRARWEAGQAPQAAVPGPA